MSEHRGSGDDWPPGVPRNDPDLDFPIRDEVCDFSGRKRSFLITYYEVGLGFTLTAREERKDGWGYEFQAFSETSPYNALWSLRQRMHRALATRHLVRSKGEHELLHDTLRGRITTRDGEAVLVVDGRPVTLGQLARILRTYEGWDVRIDFTSPSETRY